MIRQMLVVIPMGLLVLVLCGCDSDGQTKLPKTIQGKDGTPMVFVPAGDFLMGSDYGGGNELPVHKVYLDAFYIGRYEVTVGQYRKFVRETDHRAPNWGGISKYSPTDKHPIIYVSWDDAVAYCEWVGGRLPTEAEWEKAARMGSVGKKYPLGDRISHSDANYKGTDSKDLWEYCAPVGSFAPNDYSLYDIAGNVWEWCADWYNRGYYAESPSSNPKGPSSGKLRVLRGGSWYFSTYLLRAAYRFNSIPTDTYGDYGFRVVSQD